MTHFELIIAEHRARLEGNLELADIYNRQRWERAMKLVVNSENTKKLTSSDVNGG